MGTKYDTEEKRKRHSDAQKRYKQKYPDRVRKSAVKWVTKHPDKRKEYRLRWKHGHIEQHRTHQAIARSIKNGTMTRKPCVICGASKTQAHHHNGYTGKNRRNVVWLCRPHHLAIHRVTR